MAEWVLATERAYVSAATGGAVPRGGSADRIGHARAALGAVASRYLAVGTPRSFGLIVFDRSLVAEAVLSLEAHRTWFKPTDLRCAGPVAHSLAGEIQGQVTSAAEALACDIVCVHMPLGLEPSTIRRGTHVNLLGGGELLGDLAKLATVVHEVPDLAAMAAGLVDGRQLDEITVFVIGDAQIALAAVSG